MKTVFVGIPVHDGKIHTQCVAGMMCMQLEFPAACAFDTVNGSLLPRNRDVLTSRFLLSNATHMLCLDSDIGFFPDDVKTLLDADVDFVSGCYSRKNSTLDVPAKITGMNEAKRLLEATLVPAGFILLSRSCVERMTKAYEYLAYECDLGKTVGLWTAMEPGQGEDAAFCKRWTSLGEKIYLNPGVVVRHYGDHCYLPKADPFLTFLK